MARLTTRQRRVQRAAEEMSRLLGVDSTSIGELCPDDSGSISALLKSALNHLIHEEMVTQYTLVGEYLNFALRRLTVGKRGEAVQSKAGIRLLDRTLDRPYPMEKLKLIESHKRVMKGMHDMVAALNDPRNGVAHGLAAGDRRGTLVFKGPDVLTVEGMEVFLEQVGEVEDFFAPSLGRVTDGLLESRSGGKVGSSDAKQAGPVAEGAPLV